MATVNVIGLDGEVKLLTEWTWGEEEDFDHGAVGRVAAGLRGAINDALKEMSAPIYVSAARTVMIEISGNVHEANVSVDDAGHVEVVVPIVGDMMACINLRDILMEAALSGDDAAGCDDVREKVARFLRGVLVEIEGHCQEPPRTRRRRRGH